MKSVRFFGTFILVCFFLMHAWSFAAEDITEKLLKGAFCEGITVDLREPKFCNGVLTTEKGGVITGPNIRIQAQNIVYTRKVVEGEPICTIEAEGDIMLELGEYIFVGERLEYDFQSSSGSLYCGRSGLAPWFVGGEIISLLPDGSFQVCNGFITSSSSTNADWYIAVAEANLREERYLAAKQVRFVVFDKTILVLPSLQFDLKSMTESPFRYAVGWGGRQGPRIGISYEFFSWNRWKAFVRFDYRLKRGPGLGLEAYYTSPDHREEFQMLNYAARDSSIFHPHERFRYRLQGAYSNSLWDDKFTIDLTYDKLSDKYMAIDYADQSLDIEIAERTQLEIRRQEDNWIGNLITRVRLNAFETVKQELPTLQTSWRPFELGNTGVISDNQLNLSYLDYAYANNVQRGNNYHSARFAFFQRLYRPFYLGHSAILTPEAGSTVIFYSNSPHHSTRWVASGVFGGTLNVPVHKYYQNVKHVMMPYLRYQYFTFPATSPKEHFIFDIEDGWYRVSRLRFGFTQNFYVKGGDGNVRRLLFTDLFANAFFDTPTIPQTIPKVYTRVILHAIPTLRHLFETAWDFEESQLDHFNIRTEWTASEDFAIAVEYRHRDSFDWRKVDRDNYVLDSFHSIKQLRHSDLSDRRDIALVNFFYRFHPNWAIEYEARHGWNRHNHTRFNEMEIDLLATLRSSIQTRLSYQHKESEDRFAVYFSIWPQGPESPPKE